MTDLKDSKRLEKTDVLKSSALSYLDAIGSGVILFDKKGEVVYFNESAQEIVPEVKIRQSMDDCFPEATDSSNNGFDLQDHPISRGLKGQIIKNQIIGIGNKPKKWLKVACSQLPDTANYFAVSFFEYPISKEVEAETQNATRFRLLFDEAPVGIQIYNREGTLIEANKAWEKIWGLKSSEVVGWYNVMKDKAMLKGGYDKEFKKALNGKKGNVDAIEFSPAPMPETRRWVNTRYFPLLDKNGQVDLVVVLSEDTTLIKKAESHLKNSEARFHNLFENAGHGMAIADTNGMIRDMNKLGLQMLGYKRNEIVEKLSVQEITHPADLADTNTRLNGFFEGSLKTVNSQKRYLRKDGSTIWVSISSSKFQDPATGEPMIIGIIDDITDRQRALAEIKSNELKFRSVFEEAGHGVIITDEEGIFLNANKRSRQMLGLTIKEIEKGVKHSSVLHPDFRLESEALLKNLEGEDSKKHEAEVKYLHKSGRVLFVRLNLSAYTDPLTDQRHLVYILEDITKRKVAIDKLKQSEEYQHEIINALAIGLMVIDYKGKILQINAVWRKIINRFSNWKSARPGRNFFSAMSRVHQHVVNQGIHSLINGDSSDFEMEIKLGQRTENWFSIRASKLHEGGDMIITLQEITVRKRVEKALEESLSNYRNIYNLTPVMMHSIDPSGKLVSVSNFWLEKLGYQRHEVIGRNLRDFLTEDSKKDAEIILPVFFEKGSIYDVSYHFVTKSGRVLETILSAIEEGKGTRSSRSLAVVSDVTPLKKAERQLKKNRQDLIEAQAIARIGSFELNVEDGSFTSSSVFDEVLEIDKPEQKKVDILKDVLLDGEFERVYNHLKDTIFQGKDLEIIVRAVTLKSKNIVWLSCLGRTVMRDGRAVKFVGTVQDVTKSKLAELEIQGLSDRLTLAMTSANIGVWEKDLKTGAILYEETMYELFDLPKGETLDSWKKISEIFHEEDGPILIQIKDELDAQKELIDHDFRVIYHGKIRHYRSLTRMISGESGQPEKMIGVVIDITKDKELLNQIEASLKEKDILVKEVHHRVKNNMQMISSILALKALDLNDKESKLIFDECTLRIKSMAVVHDQLYRFYNVSEIEISEYLDHLLSGLNALLGGKEFVINVEADSSKMNVDTALLCGLIVSELVANAFKHGFKDLDSGSVTVKFIRNQADSVLEVTNTGHEIPDDVLERKLSSLGLSLIKTFTTQLDGKLTLHEENGFRVIFKNT